MPCDSAFDSMRLATEYLGPTLYRKAQFKGLFFDMIRRGEYLPGSGLSLSTFTIGRSEPTNDEESWLKIGGATSGSADSTCGVTWNDVNYGHTEVTYQPETLGLRGPIICQDDLIYNWKAKEFLTAYQEQLMKRSRKSIENRYQTLYIHYSGKNVTDSSFTFTNSTSAAPPVQGPELTLNEATCELEQAHLDVVAEELNQEGAFQPDDSGWLMLGEDGPVYPLYIGQQASHRLLQNNSTIRQDRRDADSGRGDGADFFKRIGATKIIKNFRHVINLFPPRYQYHGNNYHRVPTFVMTASSKGFVATINNQWTNAPFEAAIVANPWVFESQVIRPVGQAGNMDWPAKTYFGDWKFVVGGSKIDPDVDCYDPTDKLARHFAEYKHAPKPIFPEYGRTIIFRRCPDAEYACETCVS